MPLKQDTLQNLSGRGRFGFRMHRLQVMLTFNTRDSQTRQSIKSCRVLSLWKVDLQLSLLGMLRSLLPEGTTQPQLQDILMELQLSDLGNCFYDKAIDEGYESLRVGRANNKVAVGDLFEMLASI